MFIAFDPGHTTGWSAFDRLGNKIAGGSIRLHQTGSECSQTDHQARLSIAEIFDRFADPHDPLTHAVLEKSGWRGSNLFVTLGLVWLIHVEAAKRGIARVELSPNTVKLHVARHGSASKKAVQDAVAALGYTFTDVHEADATALGICWLRLPEIEAAREADRQAKLDARAARLAVRGERNRAHAEKNLARRKVETKRKARATRLKNAGLGEMAEARK